MRAYGMLEREPVKGGGGVKDAPWFMKQSKAEKRKELRRKRHQTRLKLFTFRALGRRASLPLSQLTPAERKEFTEIQHTVEVSPLSHSP